MQEPPTSPDALCDLVRAFIGLGSNLDNPVDQVRRAFDALKCLPQSRWIAASGLYRSTPMGPVAQPDFINAVALLETRLTPDELLGELLHIERLHGRVRDGVRWGPRTLDLDLLLYGNECICTPTLRVPHPGVADRNFVVIPLAELAPDLHVPGHGVVRSLQETISPAGLERILEEGA